MESTYTSLTNVSVFATNNLTNELNSIDGSNVRETSEIVYGDSPLSLAISVMCGIVFVIASTSVFLNACLLVAISRVEVQALRARNVIQNNCVANIALPIISSLDLPFITAMFGKVTPSAQLCFHAVYLTILFLVQFVQSLCGIGLTLDRAYAVVRPLQYHTVGYKKSARAFLLLAPWSVAFVAWGIFALLSLGSLPASSGPAPVTCTFLLVTLRLLWKTKMMDNLVLVSISASFVVYIAIFVALKYQRTAINKASESAAKKKSLSLAVTFFLILLTTLCLYLPLPMYSTTNQWMVGLDQARFETTIKALLVIYLANCSLDPLILILRIRSIRNNLPFKKKRTKDRPTGVAH